MSLDSLKEQLIFLNHFLGKKYANKTTKLLKMTNSAGKLRKICGKTSHSHLTYCQGATF